MTSPSPAPFEPRLASAAAVIADATRARMLSYLLAGDYASAGELARAASVSPATASGHLGKLMAAELLVCEQRGRHRYYKLADDEVAHALEALALMAERRTHTAAWANPTRQRLRFARCCYGHLAGQLGVEMFSQLLSKEWLCLAGDGYLLTAQGKAGLDAMGFSVDGMDKALRFRPPGLPLPGLVRAARPHGRQAAQGAADALPAARLAAPP